MNSVITRQLNIDLITSDHNPIIEWFNDLWTHLYVIETNVYHNDGGEIIYFINDDEKDWIFFQDNKNDKFWCDYDTYWSILESKFNLIYTEIQDITKVLVENALNNSAPTPIGIVKTIFDEVENALNNSVPTPIDYYKEIVKEVENSLNSVPTPRSKDKIYARKVDNVLNNSVATPSYFSSIRTIKVDNALNNIKDNE